MFSFQSWKRFDALVATATVRYRIHYPTIHTYPRKYAILWSISRGLLEIFSAFIKRFYIFWKRGSQELFQAQVNFSQAHHYFNFYKKQCYWKSPVIATQWHYNWTCYKQGAGRQVFQLPAISQLFWEQNFIKVINDHKCEMNPTTPLLVKYTPCDS